MRKFVITFLASGVCIFIMHIILYENRFSYESVSNSMFVVGIVMFFLSLIVITGAGNLFQTLTYGFKYLFRRKTAPYKSYYDYVEERKNRPKTHYALHVFILSIGYIVISFILSQIELNSRNVSIFINYIF